MFIAFIYHATTNQQCHVGLGVNGLHTVKVLKNEDIPCDIFAVSKESDLNTLIDTLIVKRGLTHVCIEAPWVRTNTIFLLMRKYPTVEFQVRCHSQFGFLQVEAGAVRLIREYLRLQDGNVNFTFSGNSERFCNDIRNTYNCHCRFLSNLFWFYRPASKKQHPLSDHHKIRISSFGALRLLKNHTTAGAAALKIANTLGVDLAFWVSVSRDEHGKSV